VPSFEVQLVVTREQAGAVAPEQDVELGQIRAPMASEY
jgi:hypothetical protein